MDFCDGELRYKSFVDCDDQLPSQAVIRNSIGCPISMMKRYAPGILLRCTFYANVKHFFTLLGKMFFTPYGKEFFTYPGKKIFTS